MIKQHEKYLGLPSLVRRNKRNTFNAIKEKLGKTFAGWKEKMLSKAGKGGPNQSSSPSHTDLHHKLLQTTRLSL